MEGRHASGSVFHPWGRDVRGRLTYDPAGHVALQIAKGGRERFASDDLEAGTPAEIRQAWDSYHAWFGRFTVGADERSVVHHIEASLFPNWAGVDQMRLVTLEGRWPRPSLEADALRRRARRVPDAVGAFTRVKLDSGSILPPMD